MRALTRRPRLLLLLPTVFVCAICLCCLLQFFGYRFADLTHLERFESAKVPHARVERVKVDDVIAVRKFIAASSVSRPQRRLTYYYNKARSDKIGAFRALPNTRDAVCATRSYHIPPHRARVSVIISFHNEARSTLMRTIMSVYRRSPAKYLHELILIDDCSEDVQLLPLLLQLDVPPFAGTAPSTEANTSTRAVTVKTLRNRQRAGVIASRNSGARLATGDYLFFLDSHCEVNVGWLEPLLERATATDWSVGARGAGTAVSPVLDSIDAASLEYTASSKQLMGGFDWNLHFHWVPRQRAAQRDVPDVAAFKSPTFAGGIFMISRNWFFKLNAFNPLLQVWGGEAIEFSIKLWLCGGQIEIVPCSRVGHIFRKQHSFSFPHGDNGQATYLRNSKIIAESWLDAHKYIFYASKPAAKQMPVNISLSAVKKLKKDLQCRPFHWYLQHVFPQLKLPNDDFIAFGTLSCADRCLQADDFPFDSSTSTISPLVNQVLMTSCYLYDVTHWFLRRQTKQLYSSTGYCLSVLQLVKRASSATAAASIVTQLRVVLEPCYHTEHEMKRQRWIRDRGRLVHLHTQLCLDNPVSDIVALSHCRIVAPSQLFRFSVELEKL